MKTEKIPPHFFLKILAISLVLILVLPNINFAYGDSVRNVASTVYQAYPQQRIVDFGNTHWLTYTNNTAGNNYENVKCSIGAGAFGQAFSLITAGTGSSDTNVLGYNFFNGTHILYHLGQEHRFRSIPLTSDCSIPTVYSVVVNVNATLLSDGITQNSTGHIFVLEGAGNDNGYLYRSDRFAQTWVKVANCCGGQRTQLYNFTNGRIIIITQGSGTAKLESRIFYSTGNQSLGSKTTISSDLSAHFSCTTSAIRIYCAYLDSTNKIKYTYFDGSSWLSQSNIITVANQGTASPNFQISKYNGLDNIIISRIVSIFQKTDYIKWNLTDSSGTVFTDVGQLYIGHAGTNENGYLKATSRTNGTTNYISFAWTNITNSRIYFNSYLIAPTASVGSSMVLVVYDNKNTARSGFANGERINFASFLFTGSNAGLKNQIISLQKFDPVLLTWSTISTTLSNSTGISIFSFVQFNNYIGQTVQYRTVFSGTPFFNSATSNTITLTTISVSSIPKEHTVSIINFGITNGRLFNVGAGGVSSSFRPLLTEIARNEEFLIVGNIIIDNDVNNDASLLIGGQVKIYYQKNNTGAYFALTNVSISGDKFAIFASQNYILGNTFVGKQNIKAIYDGTFTFGNASAISSFTVFGNTSIVISLSSSKSQIAPFDKVELRGSAGVNNTKGIITPRNLDINFWIRNSTSQFYAFLSSNSIQYTTSSNADGIDGKYILNVNLPIALGTYTIKANATLDYITGQSNSINIKVIALNVPIVNQPPAQAPDVKEIFTQPINSCSDKSFCGFLFWIILEFGGEFTLFMLPMIAFNRSGKDINPTIMGVWFTSIFMAIFGFGWILNWLPIWSPIIIVLPIAFMVMSYFNKKGAVS